MYHQCSGPFLILEQLETFWFKEHQPSISNQLPTWSQSPYQMGPQYIYTHATLTFPGYHKAHIFLGLTHSLVISTQKCVLSATLSMTFPNAMFTITKNWSLQENDAPYWRMVNTHQSSITNRHHYQQTTPPCWTTGSKCHPPVLKHGVHFSMSATTT